MIDVFLIIFILVFVWQGYVRGPVDEAIDVLFWIISIGIAYYFFPFMDPRLSIAAHGEVQIIYYITCAIGLMLLIMAVLATVYKSLPKKSPASPVKGKQPRANSMLKYAGAVVGCVRAGLFLCLIWMPIQKFVLFVDMPQPVRESYFITFVQDGASALQHTFRRARTVDPDISGGSNGDGEPAPEIGSHDRDGLDKLLRNVH